MPDNPSIDPGTTPSIPVEGDDVGAGVIRQGVVVSWGAKDASVRVSAAAPMPVVQTGTPALPTGAAADATLTANGVLTGSLTETAPATDTASSGLNGRLQRIAQRLSTIIGVLPTALGANGGLKIEGVASGTVVPISGTVTSTPSGTQTVSGTVAVSGNVATTSAASSQADGHSATIGALADLSSASTLVGLLKAIKAAVTGTIAVSGTFWQATQPVSGTVTITPSGTQTVSGTVATTSAAASQADGHSAAIGSTTDAAATTTGSVIAQLRRIANLIAGTLTVSGTVTTSPPSNASTNLAQVAGATVAQGHGTAATALRVELPTDGTGIVGIAAGAAVIGALTANQTVNTAQIAGTTTSVNSGTVDAGTQRVADAGANTGTLANVAASATSVTVLASNTARRGGSVWNDSTSILYLKFGATASATSATVKLIADAYWEIPSNYNGRIDGIWVSATGTARVTETTA